MERGLAESASTARMKRSRRTFLAGLAIMVGLWPRRSQALAQLPPFHGTPAMRAAAWLGRRCRTPVGPFNRDIPHAAEPIRSAIRADFAESIEENICHGSDAAETAAVEIAFFFGDDGVCPRTR